MFRRRDTNAHNPPCSGPGFQDDVRSGQVLLKWNMEHVCMPRTAEPRPARSALLGPCPTMVVCRGALRVSTFEPMHLAFLLVQSQIAAARELLVVTLARRLQHA